MPAQAPHAASRMAANFFSPNVPTPTPAAHPQRCEYTSKRCENARALKPNGERHRLCDHHRRLANNNQRRWQNRKKLQQRAEQSQISALLELRHATPAGGAVARSAPYSWSAPSDTMSTYHTERPHTQQQMPPSHPDGMGMNPRDAAPLYHPHIHHHVNNSLSSSSLPPLEHHDASPQFRPQTLVLPRLRHHHVLSHALSLPAARGDSASDGLEFGGVPRGHRTGVLARVEGVPPGRVAFERSTSEPVEAAWWPARERSEEERSWDGATPATGLRARAVSSMDY